MSQRDYWIVKMDDGDALIVSRDSETKYTLASLASMGAFVPPQEVEFDPDDLIVGAVLGADNGRTRTITGITKMPGLAVTMP
jgi:hypothetical protein